jgi:hypothetical protein
MSIGAEGPPEFVVLSKMMPKIREYHATKSSLLTAKLLRAKTQDGRPAFNFMDLRRLSISPVVGDEEWNLHYFLQNAKLLENLHLSFTRLEILDRLHDTLSPSASTLKELGLKVSLYSRPNHGPHPLAGIYELLEAMAGHNMLEALSLEVLVLEERERETFIGSAFRIVEEALVKPGWSALRQVSFKVSIRSWAPELSEALQFLPDKYLSHLSKLESVAFSYECNMEDDDE